MAASKDRGIGLLLLDVGHLFRKTFGRTLEDQGFTGAESRALMHLYASEGTSQAGLAKRLQVKPITIARLLDKLEEAGWLERRPSPDDRRTNHLYLTPEGRKTVGKIRESATTLSRNLTAAMGTEEREQLISGLWQIRTILAQMEQESVTEKTSAPSAAKNS